MRDQSLRLFVFVFYQTEDGRTRIQCRFEAERADSNLLLRVGYKLQHVAVDAVTLVGGRGAVIEDVAGMDTGAGAAYFDARHAERAVFMQADGARHRVEEAGPAGAAFELGGTAEKRRSGDGVDKSAGAFFVEV